ncbi:MAG TPA: hypothetical protein VI524_14165, partial [Anaerolineales bacterium]|nr:hypothetical protein [Anaerolineales bacterium]
ITPTPTGLPTLAPLPPMAIPTRTFTPVSPSVVSPTPLPATATPVTPLPSATGTSTPGATSLPTITLTASSQLAIDRVIPASAQANTTVNLAITGNGFVDGAVLTFEGGQGTAPEVTAVDIINPMMMLVTVNVRADDAAGTQAWDVRVTNPDGSTVVLMDAFTVLPSG